MKWEEIEYFLAPSLAPSLGRGEDIKILDIGCGNGRFLSALREKYPELTVDNYHGIDLSSGLLDEARELHPEFEKSFSECNMLEINSLGLKEVESMFFVASYHHLESYDERLDVLKKAHNLLRTGGRIYMTNWALNSPLNYKKYKDSIIRGQTHRSAPTKESPLLIKEGARGWSSFDYNIKIGKFNRYYHCFDLNELEFLAKETGFTIIENRLFDNQRNFITILEK